MTGGRLGRRPVLDEEAKADTDHPDVFADGDTRPRRPETAGFVEGWSTKVHCDQGSAEDGKGEPRHSVGYRSDQQGPGYDFANCQHS